MNKQLIAEEILSILKTSPFLNNIKNSSRNIPLLLETKGIKINKTSLANLLKLKRLYTDISHLLFNERNLNEFDNTLIPAIIQDKIETFRGFPKAFYELFYRTINELFHYNISPQNHRLFIISRYFNQGVSLIIGKYDRYFYSELRYTYKESYPITNLISLPPDKIIIVTHNVLKIYDSYTGDELSILKGHVNQISCATVLSDGRIVSGDIHGVFYVWDLESGELVRLEAQILRKIKNILEISLNKIILVMGENFEKWDLTNYTYKGKIFNSVGKSQPTNNVSIFPDEKLIVNTIQPSIYIIDTRIGRIPELTKTLRSSASSMIVYGKTIILGLQNGFIDINLEENILKAHTAPVTFLLVLEDGKLVSASDDMKLSVWNLKTLKLEVILSGHTSKITSMINLKGTNFVVSGSDNGQIILWNIGKHKLISSNMSQNSSITSMVSLDNGKLGTASIDGIVKIWE